MKSFIPLSLLLASTLAIPFEVISSRALTSLETYHLKTLRSDDKDKDKDKVKDQCPIGGTLPKKGALEPVLMVPISAKQPTKAFGDTDKPIITPNDMCTIFNFEIPQDAYGKTCTLEFLFPYPKQADDDYTFSGPGHFTFTGYAIDSGANKKTTFLTQPPPGLSPPQPPAVLQPGYAYTINSGPCGDPKLIGDKKKITVSGKLCSSDTYFNFEQDDHDCPIGFYVVVS